MEELQEMSHYILACKNLKIVEEMRDKIQSGSVNVHSVTVTMQIGTGGTYAPAEISQSLSYVAKRRMNEMLDQAVADRKADVVKCATRAVDSASKLFAKILSASSGDKAKEKS